MIPGKINTHLLQDLTVLAKANQKGSIVYISPDNKIHSGTIFQKLQALIFKNKKDSFLSPTEKSTLNQSAKELVTKNLKDQIKISLTLKSIEITDDIKADINKISEYLVNLITTAEITNSKISNKNDVLEKFDHLINKFNEIRADDKKPPELSMDFQLMIDAISDVAITNKLSNKDGIEFEFLKKQFNTELDGNKKNTTPIDIEKINSIVENSAWVKKNKGVDSEKALSLGKEMARGELKGLTNNQKFNVIQKALKSFERKNKGNFDINFSSELNKLAQHYTTKNSSSILENSDQQKKMENIEEKLAEFKKTLTKDQKKYLNENIMKTVLINNTNTGLSPTELYEQYMRISLFDYDPAKVINE